MLEAEMIDEQDDIQLSMPWLKSTLKDVLAFTEEGYGLKLRAYQKEAALAIVNSVLNKLGLSIVVIFPRQSGKNELQAQIEAYLLLLYSTINADIVKISPTLKPQSMNAMRRLERVLSRNIFTGSVWAKESGYIYCINLARIYFLSASPESNIVGATASLLLEVDEAQDVLPEKFDKDIAPMAASTNATRVFWGTAWTSRTLLGRELRAAQRAEQQDGRRRVFLLDAQAVGREVPSYRKFVAGQVARLGRQHPLVRTQFFSEEIDAEGGMFDERRLALMQGSHARRHAPQDGKLYALLLDVAGEDEAIESMEGGSAHLDNPGRDSTTLTVVEVGLESLADEAIKAPTYRVVERRAWTGTKHSRLYALIKALALHWQARYLVMDATGVGAGLASFLEKALPGKVIAFTFNASTKSKLGWDFISVIETGRFKDWQAEPGLDEQSEFFEQCRRCQSEIGGGPDHRMKWGVPDGTRDPLTGELVHDDWVLSAALCSVLDKQAWSLPSAPLIIQGRDPLAEMDNRKAW